MSASLAFSRGNAGNKGNSLIQQGFPAFPERISTREQRERAAGVGRLPCRFVPSVPSRSLTREQRKPLPDMGVPHVPSVPPQKHGGQDEVRFAI
jgi:hypothetical protein